MRYVVGEGDGGAAPFSLSLNRNQLVTFFSAASHILIRPIHHDHYFSLNWHPSFGTASQTSLSSN